MRVRERAHQRRVRRDVERLEPIGVLRGIEHQLERLVVGEIEASEHAAHRVRDHLRRAPAVIDEPRGAALEELVEGLGRDAVGDARRRVPVLDHLRELRPAHLLEEGRIDPGDLGHHALDHVGGLVGRVAHLHHAPQPVQHQTRDRVDHRRVAGDRDHVARRLDRLLLRLARDAAPEGDRLARRQPPQLGEPLLRHRRQPRGELAVGAPARLDRGLVERALARGEARRHVRRHLVEAHVALALLLGVVEREAVQEGPDQLARDPGERELEGRVLEHRVVTALEGERADAAALALGDLVRLDHARRVAGARRGDRVVVGTIEPVAQADLGSAVDDGHALSWRSRLISQSAGRGFNARASEQRFS